MPADANQSPVVLTVPKDVASDLEGLVGVHEYDPYRGVDHPVELVLAFVSLSADLVSLYVARDVLVEVCRRVLDGFRRRHPDATELLVRRGEVELRLQVHGSTKPGMLRDLVVQALETTSADREPPAASEGPAVVGP